MTLPLSSRCGHCERLGVTHDVGDASPPFVAIRPPMKASVDEEPSDRSAPQVPARDAASDEVPRGAAGIAKHARAHGWTVREVYSRSPGRAGKEPSDEDVDIGPSSENASDRFGVELVTVRCRRSGELPSDEHVDIGPSSEKPSDERWACAVYRRSGAKWALDACLVADRAGGLRRVKSAELRTYLVIA